VPWYIKQLRDVPPKCPINWNDAQIEGKEPIEHKGVRTKLEAQMLPDKTVLWIRDMAVWHIIEQNRWRRPIYFAVTIPPDYISDYDPYFNMKGLVYRLTPKRSPDGRSKIDADAIMTNLTENYDMAGIWKPYTPQSKVKPRLGEDLPFVRDDSFYKDFNTAHLTRNYPAALCRVAYARLTSGEQDKGILALRLAFELDPTFPFLVDLIPTAFIQSHHVDEALKIGSYYLDHLSDPRGLAVDMGRSLLSFGYPDKAEAWTNTLLEHDPDERAYVRMKVRVLWEAGRKEQAIDVLQSFIQRTGDSESQGDLEEMKKHLNDEPTSVPAEGDSSAAGTPEGGE